MDKERKLIIAGNWKMNKTVAEGLDLVQGLKRELVNVKEVDIVVCPPFTALCEVSKAILDSNIRLGAQNMSEHNYGAYTGEIAAGMLKEFSVRYVILGHSERRTYFGETDGTVNRKVIAALANKLVPIMCVGETLAENEAGQTTQVVTRQVKAGLQGVTAEQAGTVVVAYEPVWAIGIGRAATAAGANMVIAETIRGPLGEMFGSTVAESLQLLVRTRPDVSCRDSATADLLARRKLLRHVAKAVLLVT
jgi:triosephosphate isomerase